MNATLDDLTIPLEEAKAQVLYVKAEGENIRRRSFEDVDKARKFALEKFLTTIKLQYANAGVVEGSELYRGWLPGKNDYEEPEIMDKPDKIKKAKAYLQAVEKSLQKITKSLSKNDVMILAGTDTNVPGAVPGFSFHKELKSLTAIGLSNSDVLKSATLFPAQYMESNSGKIKNRQCQLARASPTL